MKLFKKRVDPLDFYRQRRREIAATKAEDMLLLYWPGMEHWTVEETQAKGEEVRALALAEINKVIAEEEAYANT